MSDGLFKYIEKPKVHNPPYLDKDLNLQELHASCMSELSLQQSKRDQLIAFYLTITGLVSAYLFSAEVNEVARIVIFFGLFFLGCIWTTIALRYKIYKEVYWMCCKTVTTLYSVNRETVDKAMLHHVFYKVMEKCDLGIKKGDDGMTPNLRKNVIKNLTSAEYLMYLTLVLLTATSGAAGVLFLFLKFDLLIWGIIASCLFAISFIVHTTLNYNRKVIELFDLIRDKKDESFNKVFEKAWLLHFFISEKEERVFK